MGKVNTRLNYLLTDTLMVAAAALDPKALYTSKLERNPKAKHAVTLAIKKLARSSSKASAAIDQFTLFSKQGGLFGGQEAKKSALNGRCSAADWWDQYGGDCSELQEVARRIVSQCMSSSGCERNWSTFALVHTKLRNRLSHEKLHKLVFVHYNLKLRIQHFYDDMQSLQEIQTNHERDCDPCSIMINVAMYDEGNPILDWLCSSRSESVPTLDEYDDRSESPNPSRFVVEELGIDEEEVAAFRKKISGKRGKKRKERFEEEDIASDFESQSDSDQQRSPICAESEESSSDSSEGDDDGHDGRASVVASQLGDGGSRARDAAADGQPTFLRPRSKRLKKRNLKNLYSKV
ncbi:unnamed protein product [Urochloa decumbens]|uniref:HAT C-terminal dimerisation domain-containing protein n=1 Tax=Urochloa decumbens TaxID=240449 RepID=A0ABC9DFD4_9POAL